MGRPSSDHIQCQINLIIISYLLQGILWHSLPVRARLKLGQRCQSTNQLLPLTPYLLPTVVTHQDKPLHALL